MTKPEKGSFWVIPAGALGPDQTEDVNLGPVSVPLLMNMIRSLWPRPSKRDSGHYNMPREKRLEIVRQYRADKAARRMLSQRAWAQIHHVSSARTLRRWLKEFHHES